MGLFRKLIVMEWFRSFIGSVITLFILVTISNLIAGLLRSNVTPTEVLANYLLEIPGLLTRVLPISCLTASMFGINKLKNRNELTAIFAAGFSRKDFIATLVAVSSIVSLVYFLLTAYIKPFAKSKRHNLITNSDSKFKNLKSQGLRASTIGSGQIWYKGPNYFFSFSKFNKQEKSLSNVSIFYFDDSYKVKEMIQATKLKHIDGNQWRLLYPKVKTNLANQNFQKITKEDFLDVKLNETLEDFGQVEADITTLNIVKLTNYIYKLGKTGININEYLVLLFEKISNSLTCILFAVLAAFSIFNPNRRNSSMGKNIVSVFVFTIVYWLLQSYFIEMGKNSRVNPFLASFSIPMIITLLISLNFYRHRKL